MTFHTECIRNPVMRPKGGWKSIGDVEIAVAEYVDWFNHRRLHGEIGLVPPAEFEANHWAAQATEHYPENPILTRSDPTNRASTKPGAIQSAVSVLLPLAVAVLAVLSLRVGDATGRGVPARWVAVGTALLLLPYSLVFFASEPYPAIVGPLFRGEGLGGFAQKLDGQRRARYAYRGVRCGGLLRDEARPVRVAGS